MRVNRTLRAADAAGGRVRWSAIHSHRILVVDDEIVLRLLSAHVLVRSGYQVDTADDGETGWEALHAKNYDLLITDNDMPKVSGVELVKKLRSEDVALPVILVSGAMPTEELNRNPWLQLAATLPKPFTGDELLGIVQKVLRQAGGARGRIEPLRIWRSQPSAHGVGNDDSDSLNYPESPSGEVHNTSPRRNPS